MTGKCVSRADGVLVTSSRKGFLTLEVPSLNNSFQVSQKIAASKLLELAQLTLPLQLTSGGSLRSPLIFALARSMLEAPLALLAPLVLRDIRVHGDVVFCFLEWLMAKTSRTS